MALTIATIDKISQLAQLKLTPAEKLEHAAQISRTLELMTAMQQVPSTPAQNLTADNQQLQYLRPDIITTSDERERFQELAPCIKMGLYLVPQVIEEA